jgi:hypothetical protein
MESKPVMVDLRQALVLLHHALSLVVPLLSSIVDEGPLPNGTHNAPHHHKPRPAAEPQSIGVGLGGGPLLTPPIHPDEEYDLFVVAKQLKKSTASVRKMVNAGKIEASKRGNGKGQFFVKGSELLKHTSTMTTYS